jgi:hypothetical protein
MWYTYTSIIRGIALIKIVSMSTFIAKLAAKITDLGLTGPAILLLEANKPLTFVGSQLLLVAQPTLDMFLKPDITQNMADLLADSAQVEQLIMTLEGKTTPEVHL